MKRMIAKLALAFAAKKGAELWRQSGGIDGVRNALSGQDNSASGQNDQFSSGAASGASGGLGDILNALGVGGSSSLGRGSSPMDRSLGGLFGTLAGALGGNAAAQNNSSPDAMDEEPGLQDVSNSHEARPIIHAMVQMARADGQIDAEEQLALRDILNDEPSEGRRLLDEALNDPLDAKGIARITPDHAQRDVYAAAILVGDPNNLQDQMFLTQLGRALGLASAEMERLEHGMGKRRTAA